MKKVLLTAALAATMSVPAFADISITGDTRFRVASGEKVDGTAINGFKSRVRLHVTGKSGNMTVKAGFRNNGNGHNRVSLSGSNSNGGNHLMADYLFMTTKVGMINVKAGNWWTSAGNKMVRNGVASSGFALSTKVGGATVGVKSNVNNGSANDNAKVLFGSAKVGGFNVKAQMTMGYKSGDKDNNYTDIAIKGKAAGVGIAAEMFSADQYNAHYVQLSKAFNGINFHFGMGKWGKVDTTVASSRGWSNANVNPLGVSVIGSGTTGAIGLVNVNDSSDAEESKVTGVRADMKLAGLGVQVALGNVTGEMPDSANTDNTNSSESFKDIIVTKAMGKGANIKASYGTVGDGKAAGVQMNLKF